MKKIIHASLFLGLTLLLLTGATCPHKDQADPPSTPEKTLAILSKALENRKYMTVYDCFSKDSRNRYTRPQVQVIMEWTIFGVLLKHLLITWDIADIKYDDKDKHKATVTLRHYKYHSYQKDFEFVYEEDDWRVVSTMARVLGLPQEDEDIPFSTRREKEQKSEPDVSEDSLEKTLNIFKQAIEKRKYLIAYDCFSENTRSRYTKREFLMMLDWTIFGRFLKNLLINWDIVSIKYDNKHKAIITLRHYKHHSYQKDIIFVYENKGWRIDITMARLLGVPQEDEDVFTLPGKREKPKSDKQ